MDAGIREERRHGRGSHELDGEGRDCRRAPENYGFRVQRRQSVPNGYGDGVAVFTTRPDRPNELSQDISGLQPGKLYALLFCVADRDDVLAKDDKTRGLKSPLAFSARLEGAAELENLRYETVSGGKAKVGMRLIRYVFRADSDKARLVFTDRKDDGSAAPEGFQQVLNYVSFMPYYVESPDEPAEIAAEEPAAAAETDTPAAAEPEAMYAAGTQLNRMPANVDCAALARAENRPVGLLYADPAELPELDGAPSLPLDGGTRYEVTQKSLDALALRFDDLQVFEPEGYLPEEDHPAYLIVVEQ